MFLKVVKELQVKISGFQIEDLANCEKSWLARVGSSLGHKVGKYKVDIDFLESAGLAAIFNAIANLDSEAIDETGPVELVKEKFRDAAREALRSVSS